MDIIDDTNQEEDEAQGESVVTNDGPLVNFLAAEASVKGKYCNMRGQAYYHKRWQLL